jgi:phosphoserine phosphatase
MNVYDFDHTIYDGDSSVDFFIFVLREKPYLIVLLPIQIWGMILYLLRFYSKERMKEMFFIFIRYIPLREMVLRFWDRNHSKINLWYLQQKQNSDVIISASPEFLLEPLICDHLGVTLIASQIDTITGKYVGKNCFGKEKVIRLCAMYPEVTVLDFYSDNYSDAPLAYIAKNAFLVHNNLITKWGEA